MHQSVMKTSSSMVRQIISLFLTVQSVQFGIHHSFTAKRCMTCNLRPHQARGADQN